MSSSFGTQPSAFSDPSESVVDVGPLLNDAPLRPYQRWVVFLAALTIIFDGIDNQLLGIVIPTLMREWSVPRSAFALLVSLGYLGMMIGGAVAGLAGDRFGRRTALLGSMTDVWGDDARCRHRERTYSAWVASAAGRYRSR